MVTDGRRWATASQRQQKAHDDDDRQSATSRKCRLISAATLGTSRPVFVGYYGLVGQRRALSLVAVPGEGVKVRFTRTKVLSPGVLL